MKKTLLALAVIVGGLTSAQKKIEVKASYGTPSLFGISESITSSVIDIFVIDAVAVYESNGVLAVDVMMHSDNSKWQYGLGYQNESVKDDQRNLKGSFNTVLAQANYTWTNPANKFKLYSGAGVGAIFASFDKSNIQNDDVFFAFNVSPVGIQYGEKFAVFLESNIGTKGFLQGGVSYTF